MILSEELQSLTGCVNRSISCKCVRLTLSRYRPEESGSFELVTQTCQYDSVLNGFRHRKLDAIQEEMMIYRVSKTVPGETEE